MRRDGTTLAWILARDALRGSRVTLRRVSHRHHPAGTARVLAPSLTIRKQVIATRAERGLDSAPFCTRSTPFLLSPRGENRPRAQVDACSESTILSAQPPRTEYGSVVRRRAYVSAPAEPNRLVLLCVSRQLDSVRPGARIAARAQTLRPATPRHDNPRRNGLLFSRAGALARRKTPTRDRTFRCACAGEPCHEPPEGAGRAGCGHVGRRAAGRYPRLPGKLNGARQDKCTSAGCATDMDTRVPLDRGVCRRRPPARPLLSAEHACCRAWRAGERARRSVPASAVARLSALVSRMGPQGGSACARRLRWRGTAAGGARCARRARRP